ncbi:MFS transporter [Paenibacillus sp. HW567]|uniref:MFS transporter n=1 Tax=Paenibacillus sp. HW567 TaxID=1034769 RepID=UPI000376CED8|nr:MFS transporter [Paenibacillus sp. HW567]
MKKRPTVQGFLRSYEPAVWIQFTGTVLSSLTMFMIRPFLVLYLHDQMGGAILLPILITTLQPLCGIAAGMYGGNLSDRYGRKPVMIVSLLLQTVSMAGYAIAEGVVFFALASMLNGIGSALFQPAANAQISDIVKPEQRAEVYALLHMALNFGAALGPALGLMLFNWNIHVVFWLAALFLALYTLLLWSKLGTVPPPASTGIDSAATLLSSFRSPEFRVILLLTLCYLPLGFLYAQVDSTLPFHLQTHFGNYQAVLTLLLTFNGITVILLQLWIARATARFTARRMLSIAYLLFAGVTLGYGFAPSLIVLLLTELMFSTGEMLHGPHIQKAISELAPVEARGYSFALFGLGPQVSRALGPLMGGLLLDLWGGAVLFLVLMSAFLVVGRIQSRLLQPAAAAEPPCVDKLPTGTTPS